MSERFVPGGALYVFNQPPGWKDAADIAGLTAPIVWALAGSDFTVEGPISTQLDSGRAICVIARR